LDIDLAYALAAVLAAQETLRSITMSFTIEQKYTNPEEAALLVGPFDSSGMIVKNKYF